MGPHLRKYFEVTFGSFFTFLDLMCSSSPSKKKKAFKKAGTENKTKVVIFFCYTHIFIIVTY